MFSFRLSTQPVHDYSESDFLPEKKTQMRITDIKQADIYYKALIERDPSYVGIFYVGVKTTSVFCIATCRARKPKRENVDFFTTFKEALDHGYRPCKICRPTENAHQAPQQVELAIDMVRSSPKQKITDQMLRESDIQPEAVRRWFNKHYGMTYQQFQRMYRVNNALLELRSGKPVLESAMDTGYESLSGFGYTYRKLIGQPPNQSHKRSRILISRFTTPLGPMFVCATENGICLLEFVDRKMLETEFRDLQKYLKTAIIAGENEHTQQAKREIEEYFSGKRNHFTVALDAPGTPFQTSVWQALQQVPHGETSSYQQLAESLGKPTAVRAVASANGFNRIAIIIPCHRIVGKNGNLTGYGGGLERKRWLIDHERNCRL